MVRVSNIYVLNFYVTGELYLIFPNLSVTHCSRETRKRVLGKQCRPRSDAPEPGV